MTQNLYWKYCYTHKFHCVYSKFKGVEYFMGTTMKEAREAMAEWEERLLLEGTQVFSPGA